MPAPHRLSPRPVRGGFTLVELLVVIVVIGILVALLLPAVNRVRVSAFEAAVATDLAQLESAIEKFRTEYGFYPSDFSEFVDGTGDPLEWDDPIPGAFGGVLVSARWQQLLAKISPVHNEMAFDDPDETTKPRLQIWWENVGQQLAVNAAGPAGDREGRMRGPQVAAWFWTTQLFNSAQYPITGPRAGTTDPDYFTIADGAEQKVFFDFSAGQLEVIEDVAYPKGFTYSITRPVQRGGDSPMVYFHHATYLDPFSAPSNIATRIDFEPGVTDPPNLAMACRIPGSSADPMDPALFIDPNKFQIMTAGNDEVFGDVEDATIYENEDNLCSFANGRLDVYVDDYLENN